MNPGEIRFTASHEWLRMEQDGVVTFGITQHAQESLGDIVFIQLPQVGSVLEKGAEAVVLESVKAAADIVMPMAGRVVEINTALADAPHILNQDPQGTGWCFKVVVEDVSSLDGLMSQEAYVASLPKSH